MSEISDNFNLGCLPSLTNKVFGSTDKSFNNLLILNSYLTLISIV